MLTQAVHNKYCFENTAYETFEKTSAALITSPVLLVSLPSACFRSGEQPELFQWEPPLGGQVRDMKCVNAIPHNETTGANFLL